MAVGTCRISMILARAVWSRGAEAGGFLFGRRTYENLAGYWPNASEEEQVIAEPLNSKPKFVASRTLTEPLGWQNSTLLTGDVPQAVLSLKQEEGPDLHVIGSADFAQTLIEHDLVDEYRVMIDPLVREAASACSVKGPQADAARRKPGDDDGRDPRDLRRCRRVEGRRGSLRQDAHDRAPRGADELRGQHRRSRTGPARVAGRGSSTS